MAGGEDDDGMKKNKVKLLCSHGGRILPRPADGHLKYVGGETRVISLSRDVTFSELMTKVGAVVDGDMVLKYQLIPEDLDALISVRNDEDVKHMLDEYDRQGKQGMTNTPRLRTFLFPSKPIMIETTAAALELEQRYIDAVNCVIRSPRPMVGGSCSPIASFSISSACSSPKSGSPEHHFMQLQEANQLLHASRLSLPPPVMHKVQSSPSIISSHNLNLQQYGQGGNNNYYNVTGYAQRHHHHHNGYYQVPRSPHSRSVLGAPSTLPHLSLGGRSEMTGSRLGTPTPPNISPAISESGGSARNLMSLNHSHNSPTGSPRRQRPSVGGGGYFNNNDDWPPYASYTRFDGAESLPTSPRYCR